MDGIVAAFQESSMENHDKSTNKRQQGATDKSKSHGTPQQQQSNPDQRSDNQQTSNDSSLDNRKGGPNSQPDPAQKPKER